MAVTGELDRSSEDVLPAVEVALGRVELPPGSLFRHADAVLLWLQEIERDRVRVEGLQELASLLGEFGDALRKDDPRSEASA